MLIKLTIHDYFFFFSNAQTMLWSLEGTGVVSPTRDNLFIY